MQANDRQPAAGSWRARGIAAAVACAAALAVVAPWTARNCRVMDGCALVSTNAGWNLAIGAFPRATGRFETLRSSDGCREVTGQVQQDRCWFTYGVAQIRAHPWRWLSLVPAKLGFTFDHESFAVEYLHEARPGTWPEPRRTAARDGLTLVHRLLLAAAALGCVAFPVPARGRRAAVQGAALVVVAALVAFGLASDVPAFWPLAVFASVVPWSASPGQTPLPVCARARRRAARDDARHARGLLRRGPLPHRRHAGARDARGRGAAKAGGGRAAKPQGCRGDELRFFGGLAAWQLSPFSVGPRRRASRARWRHASRARRETPRRADRARALRRGSRSHSRYAPFSGGLPLATLSGSRSRISTKSTIAQPRADA